MEAIFLSNLKITYCCLKIKKLWKLQLKHVVNNQDCQIPGCSQIIEKMVNLGQIFSQKEVTQPKDVNNLWRCLLPNCPGVQASKSFANVAKSGNQDKTTSTIEVEIYTEKFQNNFLQISRARASTAEKALIATELLGLLRHEMLSIAEPIVIGT